MVASSEYSVGGVDCGHQIGSGPGFGFGLVDGRACSAHRSLDRCHGPGPGSGPRSTLAEVAVSLAERDAALADLRQELAAAFPGLPARLELTERPPEPSAAKPASDKVELIVEVFRVLADGSRA